jgi:hypothetical protein
VGDDDDEDESGSPDASSGPDPVASSEPAVLQHALASSSSALCAPPTSPCQNDVVHHSSRVRVLTQAGKAYAEERAAMHTHLKVLWAKRTTQATGVTTEGVGSCSEGVEEKDEDTDSLKAIEPDEALPDATAGVVIEEQAHITIRSDKHHDPTQPDYDMSIPPATYEEAVQHADKEKWLEAMKAELQTMKEMNVYTTTSLPSNRKAIGCRWVLEFKEDNKGGSMYKVRLIAQGFSQVPGVDYGATFAPVIKPALVCLLPALACQNDWEIDTFDAK